MAADPDTDRRHWQATQSAVAEGGQVSLRGLPPLVVIEVLFGVQQRVRGGAKVMDVILRAVCDTLRRRAGPDDRRLPTEGPCPTKATRALLTAMARDVRRALTDPARERAGDDWDLAVFGHPGRLSFTGISQPWLARAAKAWAGEELPRHRGGGATKVREKVNALARLSESLRARDDHGLAPDQLGRKDIEAFLNRLGLPGVDRHDQPLPPQRHLPGHPVRAVRDPRPRADPARAGSGRRARRLRPRPRRHPRRTSTRRTGPGPAAGDHGRAVRPPRQPAPGRGQDRDADRHRHRPATRGHPQPAGGLPAPRQGRLAAVLVYDNAKADRLGRRLPISQGTAAVITEQQERVRARFPDTPLGELKLLPSPRRNPHGRRAITIATLDERHRAWARGLGLQHRDGTEFDPARLVPYAYRHSYAQRHADAGVPIDVLAELLDHRNLNATRGYYRVGEDRRRTAVDTVTAMSFDRHGTRIWRDAEALLDAEHARYAVGEVAVPYGRCTEPSNVQAGGGACPVRFRCAGCDHFRTDVSYLPDLTAHLDDLLRTRERLAAAIDGVDDWARVDATPSQQEITRIRRLITRINGDLDQTSDADRAAIDEAVTVLRRHRAVHLGMPAARPATATTPTETTR